MKRIKKVLFVLLALTIAFSAIITTASAQEAIGYQKGDIRLFHVDNPRKEYGEAVYPGSITDNSVFLLTYKESENLVENIVEKSVRTNEAIGMHNGKQVDTDRISSVVTLIGAIGLGSIISTVFISFFAFIRHRRSANIIT
ncbi:MAG: hypothetical protein ACI4F5_02290 [Acutalibacteraceae bacterium]